MSARWKNISIGFFVLSSFAICIGLILFLKPSVGDGKQILKVRFSNISGIHKGTRVSYAGRPIGEVVRIEEMPNARAEAIDFHDKVYYYQLQLCIDSKIAVYTTDEITICTSGLMGEKSIAILPKAPIPGTPFKRITNEIIYANSIDALENTISQIGKVALKTEKTLDYFDKWFQENGPVFSKTLENLSSAANCISTSLNTIEKENLIGSIKEATDLASDNLRLLSSSINDDKLLSRLATLFDEMNDALITFNTDGSQTLSNINRLTTDLVSGTGTLGRFFIGDDFYLRINSLMTKSETLMNDINHYGLLFQYNKQWQRLRTKKMNRLKSLESPNEFKAFFETEIDEISTSLGRISEMLEKADQAKERETIMKNAGFQKDFAILLRQIKALNDAVTLFNQNMVSKINDE